ncbi:MAG: hypothetical protein NWE93_06820 [Candidatus Bathyarchaeota archaeon]|nr:hypothetical protein [Candidatus Bathyarchaeota archaeon]
MSKVVSSIIQGFFWFTNRSLIKNLLVITFCILLAFTLAFFPYQYYASAKSNNNSDFEVGIHYVYEQDEIGLIYDQVARIHDAGFKTIRITLECTPTDYTHIQNQKTDRFFAATDNYGLKVALIIKNLESTDKVDYYLTRWGSHLSYIQIFNEPELSSTWSLGAMFTDDEIVSKFNLMYQTIQNHNLQAQYYTNFGIGYLIRSNVPMELSAKLDFVGLDIFMDSFLVLSPHFVKNLHEITGKDVIITEFGMSTSNDQAQCDFLIKGLNLYKNMGLKGCWLVYWNSAFDSYGIRDRPAEQAVRDWIAENT